MKIMEIRQRPGGEELVPNYRVRFKDRGPVFKDYCISVVVEAALKDRAQTRATSQGKTMSAYIRGLLMRDLL